MKHAPIVRPHWQFTDSSGFWELHIGKGKTSIVKKAFHSRPESCKEMSGNTMNKESSILSKEKLKKI